MSEIVDARGMACPLPVIKTKKVLDAMTEGSITTIVDNEAARENVVAFAAGMGCEVDVTAKDDVFEIRITKTESCENIVTEKSKKTVYFVTSSEMGRGSSELGAILMKSFMFTVFENDQLPDSILFVNSGVQLTCEGSPVLDYLSEINGRGVEILSCGTCLDYFKIKSLDHQGLSTCRSSR